LISCTEFIPLYSEFFKFLETKGGHAAVVRYWEYISDNSIGDTTNPNSLASFVEKYGFEGTWRYWSHTLTEEACDVLRIYDPKMNTYVSHMRHCPSKGMLLSIRHIEPYSDYCGHCALIYDRVLQRYGIRFKNSNDRDNRAECRSMCYQEGCEPGEEAWVITEGKEVMDITAKDNKYLHRDFHLSGDLALRYCGEQFGDKAVCEFLTAYTCHYYAPQIEDIRKRGLSALEEWIVHIYEIEEASELLHTEMRANSLTVTIEKSPAIAYMHSLNQEPSKYYIEETRTLYSAIADACDLSYILEYYREDGAAQMRFFVPTCRL